MHLIMLTLLCLDDSMDFNGFNIGLNDPTV
jgi:hypothetical protein